MTDPVAAILPLRTPHAAAFGVADGEPLNGRVYATLRAQLMAGVFEPGEVVSIRGLAKKLGTSTMPVREALHRLIGDHALEARANRTIALPLLRHGDYLAVCDVRLALEGLAAERAAGQLSPDELDRLDELTAGMAKAALADDPHAYLALNKDFHLTVYQAAGNPLLLDLIEKLWVRAGPVMNYLFRHQGLAMQTVSPHETIIAALRRADGEAARLAVQRDIREATPGIAASLPL
ncbi:MAG: GntR family transcriptional regulator [Alphaproteobacteria bacterium]|nr:GntR family transcriptional regulator [Alphaproteobacteria bacterium]